MSPGLGPAPASEDKAFVKSDSYTLPELHAQAGPGIGSSEDEPPLAASEDEPPPWITSKIWEVPEDEAQERARARALTRLRVPTRSPVEALCQDLCIAEREENKTLLAKITDLRAACARLKRKVSANGIAPMAGPGNSQLHEPTTLPVDDKGDRQSQGLLGHSGLSETEGFVLQDAFHRASSFARVADNSRFAPVAGLCISPDGLALAAMWDGSVHLRDLQRNADLGRHVLTPPATPALPATTQNRSSASTALVAAAFASSAPDHVGLAVETSVQLWRFGGYENGLLHGHGGHERPAIETSCMGIYDHNAIISALDFHGSQGLMATAGDDGILKIWDASRAVMRGAGPGEQPEAPSMPLRSLGMNGNRLTACSFLGAAAAYQYSVAATGLDGSTAIWDLRCPRQVCGLEGTSAGSCLECHEGSHLLATGCIDGQVCTWDMRTLCRLRQLAAGVPVCPRSLAVSPCGSFLAMGCQDGELVLFELSRQCREFHYFHHSDAIAALAWTARPPSIAPSLGGAAPGMLACASLDGSWTTWTHTGAKRSEEC